MNSPNQNAETFILGEIWYLTISAAFQHVSIYKPDCSYDIKNTFRKELQAKVNDIVIEYNSPVSEQKHIENIKKITDFEFDCVVNDKLIFGVSQKILNVYLKYLWCIGKLQIAPPHFPVDGTIQQKLKIKNSDQISWSKMTDEKPYLRIIEIAKNQLNGSNYKNIAELELSLFNNRKS